MDPYLILSLFPLTWDLFSPPVLTRAKLVVKNRNFEWCCRVSLKSHARQPKSSKTQLNSTHLDTNESTQLNYSNEAE